MQTELQSSLKKIFGYDTFRPGQEKVINTILNGQDMLVLMPTGAGKSLCFQLPAIMANGVTIVISPLISLIHDQVQALRELGIETYHFNSTTSSRDKIKMFDSLENTGTEESPNCKCKLIYTTPETVYSNDTFTDKMDELYENGLLEGFVIDEAHCVSNWGHDFRDKYLELKSIKEYYPLIPIWSFTATATPKVQLDIIKQLKLVSCKIFRNSFIRHNLSYQIYEKMGKVQYQVSDLIRTKYKGQSGIVYCLSRAKCEELANYLTGRGISANYYHAQMPPKRKTEVQNAWLAGKIKVIVATIAFALGINKADVRFVIHTNMPKSVESYYQETGRAGRDGKASDCILYYNTQDKVILKRLADKSSASGFAPTKSNTRIDLMFALCQNRYDCLKMQLSNYLGEYISYSCLESDNQCRNCSEEINFSQTDFTILAQKIVAAIKRTPDMTRGQILRQLDTKSSKYNMSDINRVLNHLIIWKYLQIRVFVSDKGIVDGLKVGSQPFTAKTKILMKHHLSSSSSSFPKGESVIDMLESMGMATRIRKKY